MSVYKDTSFVDFGPEGYGLEVNDKGVFVYTQSDAGLFYAKNTLRQLFHNGEIPFVEIKDKPRFPYRGLMLDVSRHFFTKEEIKNLLDIMSFYKLNTFHWHLTDDGGWRIEIESYPKLTEQASYRTAWEWKQWWREGGRFVSVNEEKKFGGFYTKSDIREIVDYASERNITIIPEIEFPGHSREVFAAYPELCCSKKPYIQNTFCVGNDSTYIFMEKVLNEVMDLFPSKYIHIGGDETNTKYWKSCPMCQKLMMKEGFDDIHSLHKYIIGKAEDIINNRGKRLIGWDEIADEGLDKSSVIMSWRGEQAGLKAAENGYDVILSPLHYLYLDYFQSSPDKEPLAHDGYTPLKKVFTYTPLPDSLDNIVSTHILGVQGNLWTEWISDKRHLEYMAFPRALAVAELGWSYGNMRTWEEFRDCVDTHIVMLRNKGINSYRLSGNISSRIIYDDNRMLLELECERGDVDIRYSLEGDTLFNGANEYIEPIEIKDSLKIRAAAFKDRNRIGDVYYDVIYKNKAHNKSVSTSLHWSNEKILTDGYLGSKTYLDGSWFNFSGNQEFIVDLGESFLISKISTRWMQLCAGARRYLPENVEFYISEDGKNYQFVGEVNKDNLKEIPALQFQKFEVNGNWKCRFVKMVVKSNGGGMSIDEILII
ncbi:family 20 glycosylhydrolase [uncultured Bacteroides sp.]|uniref:glycoside hydrolase family 20 protein n=1 Tax=uncultured Bacteroides sp. TaxID=162156 RepID=UPI002609DA02|nr:family 20 glycosylhydrolase [uncultured Bacteroides sp.]